MDWLTKIDPNNVLFALSVFGTLGTWVYHKIRGEKTDSFSSIIGHVMDNFIAELMDQYVPTEDVTAYLKKARDYIEERVWTVLSKRGVPRIPLTESLVHSAIEKGTAYLGNELAKRRIPVQFDEIAKRLADANAKLIALQTQSPPKTGE